MPTSPARPASDSWRDAEGTPIPLPSWIEQVTVDKEHGCYRAGCTSKASVQGSLAQRVALRWSATVPRTPLLVCDGDSYSCGLHSCHGSAGSVLGP
jgi:hypothetical protein